MSLLVGQCHCFHTVGDFFQRPSFLNVSGEEGNDSTGAYDGYGEPDDAPKRPAKRFSFHMETNERTMQVRPRNTIRKRLKALNVSSGCTRALVSSDLLFLDGFGEPSVCLFGCRLLRCWPTTLRIRQNAGRGQVPLDESSCEVLCQVILLGDNLGEIIALGEEKGAGRPGLCFGIRANLA